MSERDDLIQSLCADLEPVKPVTAVDGKALLWLLASAVLVVLMTVYFGPVRATALQQLFSVPRFFLETALGVIAIVMVTLCAFRAAVPGRLSRGFVIFSYGLLALWLAQYIFGLFSPALAPSVEGERHACWLQTMVVAIPPMLLALVMIRRLYPLQPLRTTFSFCLAAGMLPALYMQIACVYEAAHILHFHILPALGIAVVGSGLAWWLMSFKRSSASATSHSPPR